MRVMWIWHAAVVAEYRKPLAELGQHDDLDLVLLTPKRWPERAGQMVYAEADEAGAPYQTVCARTLFTGFYYIYMFPSLLYQLLKYRPDVVYCYEEAHTFIAACVLFLCRVFLPDSRVLLYAAQNIKKRYPIPFRLFERYCFKRADAILACGTRVAATLRSKGYRGDLHVVAIPTDAHAFAPDVDKRTQWRQQLGLPDDALVTGYAGKLVEEKGLRTLLRAFGDVALTHSRAHLALAGGGPLHDELRSTAAEMGIADRVHLVGIIHNTDLPGFMNALDVFVLPSETRSNWREQFGRVAVEAMACGVPVIGSDSGEIPTVLGDAGLVFQEGDRDGLARQLSCLLAAPDERTRLSVAGRERVVRLFSVEQVARRHYELYKQYNER
ncbi:MAG TPA: glycosyltransferase [Chloroflexia bacterium]|nr:glycosyltransferase [Chloroflexia bacterium]